MMNATKTLKEAGAAKTVLIVEDNELNMKLFHDLLEAHGYNILQTKDGMGALRLAREHHPDLILMDIQLSEVSGLEVNKWRSEEHKSELLSIMRTSDAGFSLIKKEEQKVDNRIYNT